MPRICFVSPFCYPLFNTDIKVPFGGSEVRISQIAKKLSERNHFDVTLIVSDHGQPHIEQREGVTIYSWRERPYRAITDFSKRFGWILNILYKGGKVAYRFSLRLKQLFISSADRIGMYAIKQKNLWIYGEVDAAIYIMHGNSNLSAELAFYCRKKGKKYIFLAGSDMDYYPEYKTQPRQRDIYGVSYALKAYAIENAHLHIVQNEHQARLLKEGYGRSSTLIKNPIDPNRLYLRNPVAKKILWVGKSDERVKQPSLVLKLARQLPEFDFVIIMNQAVSETHHRCLTEAKKLVNVTLLEQIPFDKIESYFADARLHLNTSLFEGFPNTFLQAAKYGVPTLALNVDPGKMLSKYGCGHYFEGDFENMKEYIRKLMRNDRLTKKIEKQALSYVKKYHDQDLIIQQYEDLFHSVLEDSGDFSSE